LVSLSNPGTMKKFLLLSIILISCHSYPIFGQERNQYTLTPDKNGKIFNERGRQFTYQAKDNVYVSIGYNNYRNGEYIFDITIDNQSEDTLNFDPQKIYLFRYNKDTLAEKRIYYALNPELVLDSIDYTIVKKEQKIKNNTFLSIFLGVLYLTSEVAGFNGDLSYEALETIRFTHDLAQIGLDIARQETGEHIYDLEFAGDYWLNGALNECIIIPHTFKSGKIHFKVPNSEVIKIYVPIEYRLYSYTFAEVQE
jgi:hypothetical protein